MAKPYYVSRFFLIISHLLATISLSWASKIGEMNNETLHSFPYDIIKVGCVDTWTDQNTPLSIADDEIKYDEDYTHWSCSTKCLIKGRQYQLSFLKGALCECALISDFDSVIDTNESNCNVRCPIKGNNQLAMDNRHVDHHLPEFPCGGNQRYSVYCTLLPGSKDCNRFQMVENDELNETALHVRSERRSLPVLENECAQCNGTINQCMGTKLSPYFDYFPLNSPLDCVNFCDIHVDKDGSNERRRTAYSVLMWWIENETNVPIPICHCMEHNQRTSFTSTWGCTTPCPGDPSGKPCGRKQPAREGVIYGTVYCNEDDPPTNRCHSEVTSAPSTATTATTPTMTTSTMAASTRQSQPTVPSSEGTTTWTSSSTTVTTATNSTTKPTETTNPTNPTSSLSSSPTTTATTPKLFCNMLCEAIDQYGNSWRVCNGNWESIQCSKLSRNSTGKAIWSCNEEGHFETPQPDVSRCASRWLKEKHCEVEDVKDINSASQFIEELSDACGGNSNFPDKTYFGHEIRNVTKLANLALWKVRQNYININATTWSHEFPSLVERGLALDTCLIQYREPWKDLSLPSKSSVSTSLIENIEEKLFQLTSTFIEAHESRRTMQWMFTPDADRKPPTPFQFMAEIFTESEKNEEVYEFPPSEPSYSPRSHIKLPPEWWNLLPDPNVELAALSIQSQHIEYIMPGQYYFKETPPDEFSNNGSTIDNNKILNGRLISVTFGSSATNATNPLERFQLNLPGVEINFEHDIPAWGDQATEIRRKLHPGEIPTAVLASAQCVFWDMRTNTWSTIGCKLSRTSRHETLCVCNHLTSFAVLMDVHNYLGKDPGLELLTLILCPASEIALIFTIILLLPVKSGSQRMRATISKNLAICLLIGNGLVLLVLDRNYFHMGENTCMVAGIVTHYMFLCAFMWMLIEGIHLYRMVECVFNLGRSYTKHFYISAYGFPAVTVGVTSAAGYLLGERPYGSDVYCWLEGDYIWAFMAPVAIITVVNLSILFIALKAGYRLQSQHHSQAPSPAGLFLMEKIKSYKSWLKGCASLTVTLGLTWMFGFCAGLMTGSNGLVPSYIFTILNASQGIFLLFFTCRMFPENRNLLTARLPTWFTSTSGNSKTDQFKKGKKAGTN